MRRLLRGSSLLAITASFGCSALLPAPDTEFAKRIGTAVFDSEDVDTLTAGIPAFVILLDGLLAGEPTEPEPWLAGAQLNAALASLVHSDPERFALLARKALRYAERGLQLQNDELVTFRECTLDELESRLREADRADAQALFSFASAWSTWIRSRGDDVEAIGDLTRVEMILERVLELDENTGNGMVHLYLGAFASMVSPEQGGDLEPARKHFERAIELSHGEDLSAKVALALHYAERVGNRELRDRLLGEVIAADPHAKGRTLMNIMAQRRARAVLAGGADPWSPF